MASKQFFIDLDEDRLIMSLGFNKWCFLSIEVDSAEVGGKAILTNNARLIIIQWLRYSIGPY